MNNTILNNTLFLVILLACATSSTINASGLRASNQRKTQEEENLVASTSDSENNAKSKQRVVPTVTETSFDDWQQETDDLFQKDDEDEDDDDDDQWELEEWWDSTEEEEDHDDRRKLQWSRGDVDPVAIGEGMEPIVNGILERGFKRAGTFNFGFALRKAYQFHSLPIPKACGTPDGTITGLLNLWLPTIGGWETLTPIDESWEAGAPRIKLSSADGLKHEWKVNYVVRMHFEEFYGLFNARFDVHSDNCGGKFKLTQQNTITDIKVKEENPILEIVLFTKGVHNVDHTTGKISVVTEKARVQSVNLSYATRQITSQQLDQYAPWIHDYPFGWTKAKWLLEEINKYVIPSFQTGMNSHLRDHLPIQFELPSKE